MDSDFNPYAPPGAKLKEAPRKPRSAWIAFFAGFFTDVGLRAAGGYTQRLARYSLVKKLDPAYEAAARMFVGDVLPGLFFILPSIAGGYVCARLANQSEYRVALLLALMFAVLMLAILRGTRTQMPVVLMLMGISIASTMSGAWLGMRKNRMA